MRTKSFESQRLYFTELDISHTDIIVEWRSDRENIRHFRNPVPLTKQSHLEWFEKYKSDDTRSNFVISVKESGKEIGCVSASDIDIRGNSCEVSYAIFDKSERGKGYGSEAVRAFINYCGTVYGVVHFTAEIYDDNIASIKLATSLGFIKSCNNNYYLSISL